MNALLAFGRWPLAGGWCSMIRALGLPSRADGAGQARRTCREVMPSKQPKANSEWRVPIWLMMIWGTASAQESHIPLNDGWTFCQVGKEQWYSAEVPGVVQTDLLRHGLIPDFYKGSNIDSVQWIENEDWIYKRTIIANDSLLKNGHVELVFKGLDTFAEVYLNDSLLGKADNMFRTWDWPIKEKLKRGANELKIIFRSPIKEGAKLRDAYGIQLPHDNDPSGVSPYIRKAAYQFGWDFCPRLVTSGIWQEVELRSWNKARVEGLTTRYAWFHNGGNGIWLEPIVEIEEGARPLIKVLLDGELVGEGVDLTMADRGEHLSFYAAIDPQRWSTWSPHGYGQQILHQVRVEVWNKKKLSSVWEDRIGFRSAHLDRTDQGNETAFTFRINDTAVFAKGANLVPPTLTGTSSDEEWIELVRNMRVAGMNAVRIWAGGIYPPEAFYDACDTAGIMVWLDLMLANMTPASSVFQRNMDLEIGDQLTAIDHHPSIVLYCGNNELEVAWRNWGWQERYGLHGEDSTEVAFRNRLLFTVGLPVALDVAVGNDIPYVHTSPLSNWGNAEGLKNGDLHYWGVWHGDSAFSSFKNNVGRFVSEYGFQSYPDSALLSHYIDPKELYLGSPAMKRMQRSYKTDKPIWDAIKLELGKEPKTFGEFIEDSQEVQAKAYRMAIEAHMAAQPHCMGTLFWQLNDCWPGPSWSLIDYEGNWKPGMYEVQRLYGK